jgi:alpha-tubulin suppressor-like RCC1 family protein
LLVDGSVVWWGQGVTWAEAPPAVAFTQLAPGRASACALDAAGTAYCWGNDSSLDPFPDGPSGTYTVVDGFNNDMCFLDATGEMTCVWGTDQGWFGWEFQFPTAPMAQIGLGDWIGCGVDTGGVAWCWGGDPQIFPNILVPALPGWP